MGILAIDFGTTNTAIAYFDEKGKRIIEIPYEGELGSGLRARKSLPSIVAFDRDGRLMHVGDAALSQSLSKPHLCVDKIKRLIGKTYEEAIEDPLKNNIAYEIVKGEAKNNGSGNGGPQEHEVLVRVGETNKETYAPEKIASFIFEEARRQAEAYLQRPEAKCTDRTLNKIIITYPANFSLTQRNRVIEAARLAGFDEEKIEVACEPFAAACYAMRKGKISKTKEDILVVNIGAGTTDVAVVEFRSKTSEKIESNSWAVGGDHVLGGTDMDIAIVDWVINQLRSNPSIDQQRLDEINRGPLRFDAEDAKIALSEGRTRETRIRIPKFATFVSLTVEDLNKIVEPIVEKCRREIKHVLSTRDVSKDDFSKVILTGGPMSMPTVKKMVIEEFGDKIVQEVDPMMCVASGAAYSPFIDKGGSVSPACIKLRVGGEKTLPFTKNLVDLNTQLPTTVWESWIVDPFEPSLTIQVLQDIEGLSHYDEEKSHFYGVYREWGRFQFAIPPSSAQKRYFIALTISEGMDKINVTVFESEVEVRRWLNDPTISKSLHIYTFKDTRTRITIDPQRGDGSEVHVRKALQMRAPSVYVLLYETYQLLLSASTLQRFGYRLSGDLNPITAISENFFRQIYTSCESKIKELAAKNLSDEELDVEAGKLADMLIRSRGYIELRRLIDSYEWKKMVGRLTLPEETMRKLGMEIAEVKVEAKRFLDQHGGSIEIEGRTRIENLLSRLDSYQNLFQGKSDVPLNSQTGECFIEAKRTLEELRACVS